MEFVLIMMLAMSSLFIPVIELIRISVFDQMLAEATHRAARAAAADAGNGDQATCQTAIEDAFQEASDLALWVLDQDDDGTVDVVFDDSDADVRIDVDAMGLMDDPPWGKTGVCGVAGDFIRVQATIIVEPWSPLHIFWDGMPRSSQSLARNQAGTT
ncbi:MAG: hypothetical protein OXQ90_10530 [Gammaproteobacteria bacterium]|nr:hypothetical protein [Gammaproteobacteria bacterium]